MSEKLIKSKKRVQKHGEVFTPSWMVEKMLNSEGIKEACENLNITFLEPSAGEGNFLVAILKRKLEMVSNEYNNSLKQFENFSLFALSTLYGIELLPDNTNMCVMNLFETFKDFYLFILKEYDAKENNKVLESAKTIIKANIVQGNFLTRENASNEPIIFSEWKAINELNKELTKIQVERTEYTLDEIYSGVSKENGLMANKPVIDEQLDLFSIDEYVELNEDEKSYKYTTVNIIDVFREEIECDE